MLESKTNFLDYLDNVKNEIGFLKNPDEILNLSSLSKSIQEAELLIPVIGGFSAGKSSLINSFLGKDYLPVGITPETALATELHYSISEYIEAVKSDYTSEQFNITDIEQIKSRASDFRFLRMYINNDHLKAIEPLILVDMPGFESPLNLHNQAILEYINKGVHYIVLTSVEDGTLTRSMIRQLDDIQTYGRDFSFFLSKTNLRSESEINEIIGIVQTQIQDQFEISKNILPIDNNGGANLHKILSEIDTNKLFHSLFIAQLKDSYYRITERLNTTISAMGKDRTSNEEEIGNLKRALEDLIKERDRKLQDANENYADLNLNRIIESVGSALTLNIDELISSAMNGGMDSLSHTLSEIIRHSMTGSLKNALDYIAEDIVQGFAFNLKEINQSISNSSMSVDWLGRVVQSTETMLKNAANDMENIVKKRNEKEDADKLYKTITTVLAVTTTVLHPVLEVVLIFLPDLLSGILGHIQKQKQKEDLRNKLLTEIIPSIKKELREKLPEIFNQQVQDLIISISNQFESEISLKQEAITSAQQELEDMSLDIEQQIIKYKKASDTITAFANNSLFK